MDNTNVLAEKNNDISHLNAELTNLQNKNAEISDALNGLIRGLIGEKDELSARIMRIDLRIECLEIIRQAL